jgi:hypothetical protein
MLRQDASLPTESLIGLSAKIGKEALTNPMAGMKKATVSGRLCIH